MFAYTPQGGFRSIDNAFAASADEVVFSTYATDAQLEAAFPGVAAARKTDEANATIKAEISALDAKRVRPTAEIIAAMVAGVTPDPISVAKLSELNTQIAALRARLVP